MCTKVRILAFSNATVVSGDFAIISLVSITENCPWSHLGDCVRYDLLVSFTGFTCKAVTCFRGFVVQIMISKQHNLHERKLFLVFIVCFLLMMLNIMTSHTCSVQLETINWTFELLVTLAKLPTCQTNPSFDTHFRHVSVESLRAYQLIRVVWSSRPMFWKPRTSLSNSVPSIPRTETYV